MCESCMRSTPARLPGRRDSGNLTKTDARTQHLHRDADCNCDTRIPAVVKVVTVVFVSDVDVVCVVPVIRPVPRPRVDERNPIPVVLESWVSAINHKRETVDPKRIPLPKVDVVAVLRDTVGVVAAALFPIVVV
jgi:hypothetical protein